MARTRVAARMERAPRGHAAGGRSAGDRSERRLRRRLRGAAHRRDQRARVGVRRALEERVGRPLLDDPPAVHDGDAVCDLGDHAHVVRDPEERDAVLRLQLAREREDLGLHGDVQRRRRLVGDQEARAERERHGDHHALPHAARELVGVHARDGLRALDPDLREQRDGLARRVPAPDALARLEHLRDLTPGGQTGLSAAIESCAR